MARIEAQVNAQMSEVFREQVTEKCFSVCADVSKKSMSSRESDCLERCVTVQCVSEMSESVAEMAQPVETDHFINDLYVDVWIGSWML